MTQTTPSPSATSSERRTFTDPDTGRSIIQWTHSSAKDQLLYFTSPSVTTDDRWIVFLSERTGSPNLHVIDRRDGSIRQVSTSQGMLHAYVYPTGGQRGLSKASPYLDALRRRLYWIQDSSVYAADLDDAAHAPRLLCDLPADERGPWWTAFNHLSPDGRTLCVPCTDPRAFSSDDLTQWDQLKTVPPRISAMNLVTKILLIDTATGAMRVAAEVPFWVTHVQFDPKHTGRMIFNSEGNGQANPDHRHRIWRLETDGSFSRLCDNPSDGWLSHENWAPSGRFVLYHGGSFDHGRQFVAARTWEGELLWECDFDGQRVWHAISTSDDYTFTVDKADGYIELCRADPATGRVQRTRLCRHDSVVTDQDSHPHPLMTPTGRSVAFTSQRAGVANVYEVLL